ncbi:TlpA family protein disulfide reductase [Patiriisocius marinistellae]|nr:thioredoxin family protein [Patiriisocius marinistellae]
MISFFACKNTTKQKTAQENQLTEISEKNGINTLIDDPENQGDKMLLGAINKKGLSDLKMFPWMDEEMKSYEPEATTLKKIKENLSGVKIKAFMGTWCEDSQREIPRLYKILEATDFDLSNMEIVAVSHDKETPSGFEKNLNIEFVPTLIFYKNDKELGRFVEYAQENLETDILKIITGATYKHAYQE